MQNVRKITIYLVSVLLIALSISCNDKVAITGIKLNQEELILSVDGTATLKANLIPYSASAKMIWSSGNNNVATVESNDKNAAVSSEGLVTAKAAGTAVISVKTKDGKHIAECTVTVINPEPELVLVEGGTFTMGCTDGNCTEEELPAHKVTLSSYKIAKYLITQQQWEAVMGNKPSHFRGHDLPVEGVSWHAVQEYIEKLNAATGKNYRLPTEAEWEYAARGGNQSKGYKYSGSDDINAVAWHNGNSGTTTHPVGTKTPNELGIYDMSGNLWEWCNDWYDVYTDQPETNPLGPDSGAKRVVRGGSYLTISAYGCHRVSFRSSTRPEGFGRDLGFRLVLP
jgi:formylglycine-generating enzyme required for sulfatase activity